MFRMRRSLLLGPALVSAVALLLGGCPLPDATGLDDDDPGTVGDSGQLPTGVGNQPGGQSEEADPGQDTSQGNNGPTGQAPGQNETPENGESNENNNEGSAESEAGSGQETNEEPADPPAAPAEPESALVGTWMLQSGDLMEDLDPLLDVKALTFNENGTGRIFCYDQSTGAKDSARFRYEIAGSFLLLDLRAEFSLSFGENIIVTLTSAMLDADTLVLIDGTQTAQFSRSSTLTPEITGKTLVVTDVFELPKRASSDLAILDGDLIFTSFDSIERLDLDTRTLLEPLGPRILEGETRSRIVGTVQGSTIWTTCGCDSDRLVFQYDNETIVDIVGDQLEGIERLQIFAMAYNANDDRLWLHARGPGSFRGLRQLRTTNEPDKIALSHPFNRVPSALAFDGTSLWAIITAPTQVIVQIDTESSRVVNSFDVPDSDAFFSGIAFDSFNMYLLATSTDDGTSVIYQAPRRTAPSPTGGGTGSVSNRPPTNGL